MNSEGNFSLFGKDFGSVSGRYLGMLPIIL
jgi:hypothetical protein